MKRLNMRPLTQSLVILLIVFGLVCVPSIMAQYSSPHPVKISNNNVEDKASSAVVYDLLIIAPTQYIDSLQPLVVHKNNVGIKTKVVTLDDVYHQMFWQGRDEQEKIKYFIKTAKEVWGITYVLFVGDFQAIPIRYVYNADNNTGYNEPYFISELYYADLYDQNHNFSTWDSSNNGIYGEWYGSLQKTKISTSTQTCILGVSPVSTKQRYG